MLGVKSGRKSMREAIENVAAKRSPPQNPKFGFFRVGPPHVVASVELRSRVDVLVLYHHMDHVS